MSRLPISRVLRPALLGVAGLVCACASDNPVAGDALAPPIPSPAADARTGTDAYRYLVDYTSVGLHRTGTDGGTAVAQRIAQRLTEAGLVPVIEPFTFTQFLPKNASLKLAADGVPIKSFPLWYSGRTAPAGVTGALIDVGSGSDADFAGKDLNGKIVLARIVLTSRAVFVNLAAVQKRAAAAGAAALVAAIQGPGNQIVASNAESEAGLCGLPTLFIGKQDGQALARRSGETASFVLDAELVQGTSYNVVATIAGAAPDTLVVGTPTNGWFTTAAERGGGVGTLLTLARYYATRGTPAKTLVFVFTGGHEVGFIGLQRFIDAHPDVIARTYAYVHAGAAIAGRYDFENPDGSITQTPIADPARTLYISENPPLTALAVRDQIAANLAPALSLLPSLSNPGEQRRMYAIGVPIVSISGTTEYFHTVGDVPDTTSAALLDPAVRFYGGVIDDLLVAIPADIIAANTLARSLATPYPKPVCSVPGS
jgi:hypothetical protein